MSSNFDERSSKSAVVESIWRAQSDDQGTYISIAANHWSLCVARENGKARIKMFGPETRATLADFTANAEVVGINFRVGTYMPHLPPGDLVDDNLKLLEASSQSFWLKGSAWKYPDYDDADVFAERLIRDGLVIRDPVVAATLRGDALDLSPRAVQYRFLAVTGMTQRAIGQIQRARSAAALLTQGDAISEVVGKAGYADQPHLTRALKHFMGRTPAQIMRASTPK